MKKIKNYNLIYSQTIKANSLEEAVLKGKKKRPELIQVLPHREEIECGQSAVGQWTEDPIGFEDE